MVLSYGRTPPPCPQGYYTYAAKLLVYLRCQHILDMNRKAQVMMLSSNTGLDKSAQALSALVYNEFGKQT